MDRSFLQRDGWLPDEMERRSEAIIYAYWWFRLGSIHPSIFLKSGTKVLQKADGMMVESVKHIDVDKGSLIFLLLFSKPEDRKGLEQRDKMPKMGRKSAGAHGPNQSNKQPRSLPT